MNTPAKKRVWAAPGQGLHRQGNIMNIAKLSAVLLAASTLCGCNLDIKSDKSTSQPVVPASAQPASSVPPSTYTGQEKLIFTAINTYRSKLGVGQVAQDTSLDLAAQMHETYQTSQAGGFIETHDELATGIGFYAVTPHDRAIKAGFSPATAWIGEVIGNGQATVDPKSNLPACVSQLLDSVYHLEALTSNVEKIGIHNDSNWACVLEGATITGTDTMTLPGSGNGEPIGGGQQMSLTSVAVSPYSGETAVLPAMSLGENPTPALPTAAPGHPVMLRVRVDLPTDVLRVDSFLLQDISGNNVPGTILLAANAAASSVTPAQQDTLIQPGVAFFVPSSPLNASATYTAIFQGARNGVAVNETWSFTTQ
jgi:uncharacterized protein YkwD